MLQFIATESNNFSVAEQVQMAVEAGCAWGIISLPNADDAYIREIAGDITDMCREAGTILTIEDRPELARSLGVHGVLLTHGLHSAPAVRDQLGPEAIIGAEVRSADALRALVAADADYVEVRYDGKNGDAVAQLVAALKEASAEMAVVVRGDFAVTDLEAGVPFGADGIATGRLAVAGDDPVATIEAMIKALQSK